MKSMVTLLQIAVYDNAFAVIRVVMADSAAMGGVLLVFLTGGAFMILNILIGVIREIVSETTQKGKEDILIERVNKIIHTEQIDRELYSAQFAHKLRNLQIDAEIVENVFDQAAGLNETGVAKTALIAQLRKLLHPPETQDMLLAMKKLENFRHKLLTRCAELPVDVPRLVQEKILAVVKMRAPDVHRRLIKRLQAGEAGPHDEGAQGGGDMAEKIKTSEIE